MSIADILRPQWKHSNKVKQIRAINEIRDQKLLSKIYHSVREPESRIAAINRMEDQDLLFQIALNDAYIPVSVAAVKRIRDEWKLKALFNKRFSCNEICWAAVENMHDEEQLTEYLLKGYYGNEHDKLDRILDKIHNPLLLLKIARSDAIPACYRVVRRLNSRTALQELLNKNTRPDMLEAVAQRLESNDDWLYFFKNAKNTPTLYEKISKIEDVSLLNQIREQCTYNLSKQARERLDELETENMRDVHELERLALSGSDLAKRLAAIKKIDNQAVFIELIKTVKDTSLISATLKKLKTVDAETEKILFHMILQSPVMDLAQEALKKIIDQEYLFQICMSASSPVIVQEARKQLTDPERIAIVEVKISVVNAVQAYRGNLNELQKYIKTGNGQTPRWLYQMCLNCAAEILKHLSFFRYFSDALLEKLSRLEDFKYEKPATTSYVLKVGDVHTRGEDYLLSLDEIRDPAQRILNQRKM